MRSSLTFEVSLAALVVGGCAPPAGEARFTDEILPLLERRCLTAACHGVAPGAEVAGEVIDRRYFYVDVDGGGRALDTAAAYANVKARINTRERPEMSSFLRKPLALAAGGVPHAGGHPFERDSPDWIVLRDWIAGEPDGGEGTSPGELTALERRFADDVLPVLRDRGCMIARCHGVAQFAGLPLATPMDGAGGDFSVADIRASREAARANLALSGDLSRSRLLVKALPLDAGGIPHRGGNDTFFPRVGERDPRDDPGARALLAWAEAERASIGAGTPQVQGVVFVRGPAAPRAPLDLDTFRPGSDLWFYPGLEPGASPVRLTGAAHDGPADVRDPAISLDGTRVAFAMRRAIDACHQLWELGLDGGGLRQLTFAGCNRWPVYGPADRIHFASNRAGHADVTGRARDLELYRLEADGTATRLTFTPTPEATPTFLATGEFRGSLAFTTVRAAAAGARGAIFRFPPDHDRAHHLQPEYHPHHGQTAPAPLVWSARELPDGRDVAILLDWSNRWEGGRLAVVERQFGPDASSEAVTVAGFQHAWSVLTPDAAIAGVSPGGLWRDPAPLPDGRVIAARAAAAVDLDDPAAAPDTALVVLAVDDRDVRPRLGPVFVLHDSPGLADDQPAVVWARPAADDEHADAWDDSEHGLLRHSGVAVVEAINRELAPVVARMPRGDLSRVRILTWPSWEPATIATVDPQRIANRDPASTWWSNGIHLPRPALDEVALAADGTLVAELPARVPVQLQLLDSDGLAAGAPSQLWIHVQGGERVPQGAQPRDYGRLCAGCHGALDGDPAHAMGPLDLDAVTQASVTLSTFAARDPRRPLPPVRVGAAGAKSFDFGRDLAPSLARSCAVDACHAGSAAAGGLDLTPAPTAYYDAAYEALQAWGPGSTGGKRYIDERNASARGSYLMEKLLGRELDAPRPLSGRCPPPGAAVPPLDPDVIDAFARWLDTGAVYRSPEVP